jgi:DMSO/TMAO reductase YedYZ heme-binding membrane subunit
MIAAVDSKIWWYVSRASGLVLWAVLAASVLWGFSVSTRLVRRKGMPAWMLDLHKHLGTLAVVFTVVHLVSLWADTFVVFGWRELFVPMASTWRPGAVTWGIAAFYLLVIVQVTSWFMRRLPRKLWHSIHMLSLPLLVTGTAHGIMSGADWSNRVVQWTFLVGAMLVVWLATFRVAVPRRGERSSDRLAAARAARDAAVAGAPTTTTPTTSPASIPAPPMSIPAPPPVPVAPGARAGADVRASRNGSDDRMAGIRAAKAAAAAAAAAAATTQELDAWGRPAALPRPDPATHVSGFGSPLRPNGAARRGTPHRSH